MPLKKDDFIYVFHLLCQYHTSLLLKIFIKYKKYYPCINNACFLGKLGLNRKPAGRTGTRRRTWVSSHTHQFISRHRFARRSRRRPWCSYRWSRRTLACYNRSQYRSCSQLARLHGGKCWLGRNGGRGGCCARSHAATERCRGNLVQSTS